MLHPFFSFLCYEISMFFFFFPAEFLPLILIRLGSCWEPVALSARVTHKFIINQKTGLGPWGSWGWYGGIIINIRVYIFLAWPVERFDKLLGERGASFLFK